MTKAPERWFCKTNDPALKFLWYLFFENRSAFIRQVCLPHLKLRIKWLCRGSSPQRCVKTAFVINGKIKKFPSWKSPESLDDTAFGAVSSKLADHDGRVSQFWGHTIPSHRKKLSQHFQTWFLQRSGHTILSVCFFSDIVYWRWRTCCLVSRLLVI